MQQTAVEWFAKELYEKFEMKGDGKVFDELLDQAKEMEKEQIMDAHINGQSEYDKGAYRKEVEENSEQYYNETFKNK
jgi:hypothetical protein